MGVQTVKKLVDDLADGTVSLEEFMATLDREIARDDDAPDNGRVPASLQRATAGLRKLERL